MLASLICHVIVLAIGSSEQLGYLTDVKRRVAYSSSARKKDNFGGDAMRFKIACLMCIEGMPNAGPDTLNPSTERLQDRLAI